MVHAFHWLLCPPPPPPHMHTHMHIDMHAHSLMHTHTHTQIHTHTHTCTAHTHKYAFIYMCACAHTGTERGREKVRTEWRESRIICYYTEFCQIITLVKNKKRVWAGGGGGADFMYWVLACHFWSLTVCSTCKMVSPCLVLIRPKVALLVKPTLGHDVKCSSHHAVLTWSTVTVLVATLWSRSPLFEQLLSCENPVISTTSWMSMCMWSDGPYSP